MATLNPAANQLKPLSRAHTMHSMQVPVDENKFTGKSTMLGADKKPVALKTSRGALSEITNNTIITNAKTGKSILTTQPTNVISRITRSKSEINGIPRQNPILTSSNVMIQPHKIQKTDQPKEVMMPDQFDDEEMIVDEDVPMEQEQPENIDLYDAHDPQCVGEYVNDIFEYYRQKEIVDKVNSNYLKEQYNINDKMRAILVDWMMAVHVRFKMLSETFFLSVNIVDRYLSAVPIPINKLQLVGITSMLLAAKYEEIYSPEIKDFIVTSDNACTHDEVLSMERSILSTLKFHMSTCTPLHFLRRFSKAAGSDSRTHSLSKYLTEISTLDYKLLKYVPSMIAAASIYVARRMTMRNGPFWNITLEHYTCYKEADIMQCALEINDVRKREENTSLKATKKKYLSPKLMEVAAIPPVDF
ncbi:cyclin [Heterostelium album PN500]|uniref:Cyclin n=1 Tax=Heterostelium pallidum (strain ATCC 26659 / Pp 5 / PN500) TaxID=670386 RepID=D3AX20_HETP5|nr:cyclin [Heterostelium album PN500]EFA86843.1 cyclin [Heterostelium album PN500]|eukprot:XP_020438946.1 cyclin [Heterostelium album PN500]